MKFNSIILLLSLLAVLSCNSRDKHRYIGTWVYGAVEYPAALRITHDSMSLNRGQHVLFQEPIDTTCWNSAKSAVFIESRDTNEVCQLRFKLEFITPDRCIISNYKCNVNRMMIDEVVIAHRHSLSAPIPLELEIQQIDIHPKVDSTFYVIYADNGPTDKLIRINDKKIGYATNMDSRQLFSSNRTFLYNGKRIACLNPIGYGLHSVTHSKFEDMPGETLVVLKKGFNQSPRSWLNEELGLALDDRVNVEYFELLTLNRFREKYNRYSE